ncbi:MAG: hypothetical protein PPP55_11475 [Halorubrum sp.]
MERRRVLAAVGVTTAGVLAGCSDALGGEDGADVDAFPFAEVDWRDGNGLDVETLAERHANAAVEAGGVTLFSTAQTGHDGETEPSPWLPSQTYESSYDLDNERQYLRQELTESEETDRTELYVADGEALVREQFGSEVRYDRQPVDWGPNVVEATMREDVLVGIRVPQGSGEADNGESVYEGLNNWEPTFEDADEVDGESSARFVADSFEGSRSVPQTVESASAVVRVFESGFVPHIQQSWAGPHGETTASVDVDIEYRDRGAMVPEPEWAETARTETGG